jgi:MarC family membrane protein
MDISFSSAVVVLLLVMDPIGNVPLFVALLKDVDPARRSRVIVRECAIAFGVLVAFAFAGGHILRLLGLSQSSLSIAGGLILFLIALRMIFRREEGLFGASPAGEPFIVPLAIPSIAGPTAIATVILLVSQAPERIWEWLGALTIAMALTMTLLAFAQPVSRLAGERGLLAFERLMGLVLTAIAVEMLLRGVEAVMRQLPE